MDTKAQHPLLKAEVGKGDMKYAREYGDLANGRIGNGTLNYTVPLQDGGWQQDALSLIGIAKGPGLAPAAGAGRHEAVFRINSPYLFLKSRIDFAGKGY